MKQHKWLKEIHAWASGVTVQFSDPRYIIDWQDFTSKQHSPNFDAEGILWRIKPPEVAQWRKDMAQALDDGKVVEHKYGYWQKTLRTSEDFLNIDVSFDDAEYYRIRPEKKPDVVTYCAIPLARGLTYFGFAMCDKQDDIDNLKLIWDGETGSLKDAEVLK